jgi:hypothetical protein
MHTDLWWIATIVGVAALAAALILGGRAIAATLNSDVDEETAAFRYRGYRIYYDPSPTEDGLDWQFFHDGMGTDAFPSGSATSLADAKTQIDALLDEEDD